MAEKIDKDRQIKKEDLEAPVADAAEKVIEKNPAATEQDLEEEIDKELEGTKNVEVKEEASENDSKENAGDEYAEAVPENDEYREKEKSEEKNNERKNRKDRHGRYDKEDEYIVWEAKTKLGKEVREGKIKDIDEILDSGRKILEDKIVDSLINVKTDLISIGQSKGKFGGGKRRAWRQTQKKTKEGNVPNFSALAIVGDENGHVGIGDGKAKETLPARDKAFRKAKLNIIRVKRSCGSFDCSCNEKHSIPFKVMGKSGSVGLTLIPAPQGTGLVVANEVKKVLQLAGIKDIYSKTSGKKRTSFNLVKACVEALKKTNAESEEEAK